jgi:ABC-2 type transport system ATP-binding protein
VELRDRGITIESVTVQKPSLDEVFLALTGHDTHDDTHDDTAPLGAGDPQMEDAR